jgi:hypothetical protein
MRPIMLTGAPSFPAATAWFAPFPPGNVLNVLPETVSPGSGMRRDDSPITQH